LLPLGLVPLTPMLIESRSAHNKGCDGNPVPETIKLNCCGEADEHQLKREPIS
jgi:hypothetical protein